jgi:hypothetical protein
MRADEADRDDAVQRALARLPYRRAPRTLLPRIMAAVSRPWYARAWLTWPHAWQAASLVLLVALGAAAWWLASGIELPEETAHTADAMTTLARVVWRIALEPVFAYVLVLSILATFTAAAAWAALARLSAPSFMEPHA